MSNARKGHEFERSVRRKLERNGWVVIRAAASKGPADLIAFKPGHKPLFVECKVHGRLDPEDWNAYLDRCRNLDVVPILAWKATFPNRVEILEILDYKDGHKGKFAPVSEYAIDS